MTIKNILVSQLLEVLKTLPSGTTRVDLDYSPKDSKIVIYPSSSSSAEESIDTETDKPDISPDDDLRDYL